MMTDKEKVIKEYEEFVDKYECFCSSDDYVLEMHKAVLALLKEQQKTKERILRNIADNQLAVSPTGYETEEGLAKKTGEWNGLKMAYEIVENDGN